MSEAGEDRFREALNSGQGLGLEKTEHLQAAIRIAMPVNSDGSISWEERPMSKKWYWPRRGRRGLIYLLQDLPVEKKRTVYVLRSDIEEGLQLSVDDLIRYILDLYRQGTSLIMLSESGKWIAELTADGYLHFDFSIPDEKEFHGLFGACPM